MKYLLDTNTCIRYLNGRAPQVRVKMATVADSDIAISTVTQGEMYAGSAKSQQPGQSRAKQDAYLRALSNFPLMSQQRTNTGGSGLRWKFLEPQLAPMICRLRRLRLPRG